MEAKLNSSDASVMQDFPSAGGWRYGAAFSYRPQDSP
jgi:hypothetical protein